MCDFSTDGGIMKELIGIHIQGSRQLVSARDLYDGLGIKRQFTDWWKQNSRSFEVGVDYMSSPQSVNMPNGGTKRRSNYLITIDMAKELCMMSKTEKGKRVRQYFIAIERKYKAQKELPKLDSYMIADPIERAHRWIEEQKEYIKQKTLADKQAKQLQAQEADVIFSHTMLATNHSCKVRELAADLTKMGFIIGQNQLYELLRLKKYISKHSTQPMGSKVKCGYFVTRHGVNNGKAWSQTLVTPKGQKNIINKCLHGKWDKEYQQVMANTFDI